MDLKLFSQREENKKKYINGFTYDRLLLYTDMPTDLQEIIEKKLFDAKFKKNKDDCIEHISLFKSWCKPYVLSERFRALMGCEDSIYQVFDVSNMVWEYIEKKQLYSCGSLYADDILMELANYPYSSKRMMVTMGHIQVLIDRIYENHLIDSCCKNLHKFLVN